jgi:signal transduction histidine kinase/predicted ATPase
MIALPGYTIEQLVYRGERTVVYRALRDHDGALVSLKGTVNSLDYNAGKRLRQEMILAGEIDSPLVARYIDFLEEGPFLVSPWIEGIPLSEMIPPNGFELERWFPLAEKLAQLLVLLQEHHIVHRDLKPANLVVEAGSGNLILFDFGNAVKLDKESRESRGDNRNAGGTLTYISPEQTGRLDRSVDYRSDFYSAGICLYEMLLGKPPFTGTALELVHAHLARIPLPPVLQKRGISPAVSGIIMKLLEKMPEDRYAGAIGLLHDLEDAHYLFENKLESEDFVPGMRDPRALFAMSGKLKGRSEELSALHQAVERSISQGAELLLLAAEGGVGKSALLREFVRQEMDDRYPSWVVFGSWKSGEGTNSALVEAATDLVYRIIGAHEDESGAWSELLRRELGENLPILRRSIPAISLLLGSTGKERTAPPLGEEGTDNLRQISRAVGALFHLFSLNGEGLVLVLDNIHHASRWELESVRNILTLDADKPLLVVGSYRPEVVDIKSPLFDILSAVSGEVRISTLLLRGLEAEAIASWLTESFGEGSGSYEYAASIFADRFSGNPALIKEALPNLHEKGKLLYKPSEGWVFDQGALEEIEGSGSIRRLIFDYIDKLNDKELDVFTTLLCLGGEATDGELNGLTEADNVKDELHALHGLGFIRRNSKNEWELMHPPLLERFLQEISVDSIAEKHIAIGYFLMKRRSEDPIIQLQRAVGHFIKAGADRFPEKERRRISDSALKVAAARLAAGECDTGMFFIEAAASFFPEENFTKEKRLFTHFHALKARCFSCQGEYEEAVSEYRLLIGEEEDPIVLISHYGELIEAYSLLSRFEEALATGEKAFQLMGMKFLEEPEGNRERLDAALSLINPDQIDQLAKADSRLNARFLQMAITLDGSVYSQRPEEYWIFIQTLMLFVLEHGGGAEGAFVFSLYALGLVSRESRYREGEKFGRAALRISDTYRNNKIRAMCRETYGAHVAPWTIPLGDITSIFLEGYKSGQSVGEAQFTGFILMHRLVHEIFLAADFHDLLRQGEEYGRIVRTLNNREAIDHIEAVTRFVSLLTSESISRAEGDKRSLKEAITAALGNKNFQAYVTGQALFLIYLVIFDEEADIPEVSAALEQYKLHLRENYLWAPTLLFLGFLALGEGELQSAEEAHSMLLRFEEGCRENHEHLRLLLEAEISAYRNSGDAGDIYESAIQRVQKRGDLFHTALANERCGIYHFRTSRPKVAGLYFLEAYRYWTYLGVRRKAAMIKSEWGAFFPTSFVTAGTEAADLLENEKREEGSQPFFRGMNSLGIDALAMIRASRELTEDLKEEVLLERMLRIILESTGAQKAFFIVEQGDELILRARHLPEEDGFTLYPLDGAEEGRERLVRSINLSISVLRYVRKRREPVMLEDAAAKGMFINDPYFHLKRVRSVLCFPLPETGAGRGMIYLENKTVPALFTPERIELVSVLVKQAAISLQHAKLYEQSRSLNKNLQEEVLRRSQVEEGLRIAQRDLQLLNEELEKRVQERTMDLTRSYRELQETQKQLIEAEKMASLGSLVAGIAHEVNTPVGVAVTAATYLQDQVRKDSFRPESVIETADLILRNLKRAAELISSFKQVAVDQASEAARSFTLKAYLEDVVVSLRPALRKSGITVEIAVPEDSVINSFPGALSQIFTNLVHNSIIHGYDQESEGRILISGDVKKDEVVLQYRDYGKGMEKETAEKVFEPFFTTKRGSGGSGLGMHIVYNLVTGKLGGTIRCESRPGEGVLFFIAFPAAPL